MTLGVEVDGNCQFRWNDDAPLLEVGSPEIRRDTPLFVVLLKLLRARFHQDSIITKYHSRSPVVRQFRSEDETTQIFGSYRSVVDHPGRSHGRC
jgi:hypothetical protein